MESVPAYVSIVFRLTTFAPVGFLIQAVRTVGTDRLSSRILIFLLPLWIFFQAALALGGFYQFTQSVPPRLLLFGVLPALLLIIAYFIFFRASFIEKLHLKSLTIMHVITIPLEMLLYWLFDSRAITELATFEGRNFDILSGILAFVVYIAAFRGDTVNRPLLIAYNLLGVILLANIVGTAIVSLDSPMQMTAFDQPNRAVLFFPYIWLPTIVVPIVLFAHLASLWKLIATRDK